MNLRDAFRRDQILLITSYFSPGSDWNSIYGDGLLLDEKLGVTAKGKKLQYNELDQKFSAYASSAVLAGCILGPSENVLLQMFILGGVHHTTGRYRVSSRVKGSAADALRCVMSSWTSILLGDARVR